MVRPLLTSPLVRLRVFLGVVCRNLRSFDTPARACRKKVIVVVVHGVRVYPFPPTVPNQGPNPKFRKITKQNKKLNWRQSRVRIRFRKRI